MPKKPTPVSSAPISFCCCVQTPADRVNRNAAPTMFESLSAPTSAVLPSAEMATAAAEGAGLLASLGTQLRALLTPGGTGAREHPGRAADRMLLSFSSPMTAVLPSAEMRDRVAEARGSALIVGKEALLEVQRRAAAGVLHDRSRALAPSPGPPMSAVVPSAERATAVPKCAVVVRRAGRSADLRAGAPGRARAREHPRCAAACQPAAPWSSGAPINAVLPLDDSATLCAERRSRQVARLRDELLLLGVQVDPERT